MASSQQELDPKYDWEENASSFVLRFHLSGFRKQDFRVQIDGAGRLTVRGQAADARFHKVFQLPPASNLDAISGRFESNVLTITVPKRPGTPSPSGTAVEEIKIKPKHVVDEAAKRQAEHKEEATKDVAKKEEADAKKSKPEQAPKTAAPRPPATSKEEGRPTAEAAAAPTDKKQQQQADGDSVTKAVDRESLLERVRLRAEEERAKAAAAVEEEAERHRMTARCGWKERVGAELEGLKGSDWAEALVETATKNKEVIAVAVAAAALSLGLFVSARLFSRN